MDLFTQEEKDFLTPLLRAQYYGQKVFVAAYKSKPEKLDGFDIDGYDTEVDYIVHGYLQLKSIHSLNYIETELLFKKTYPMFVGDKVPIHQMRRLNGQIFENGSYSAKTHYTLINLGAVAKLFNPKTGEWIHPDVLEANHLIKII